MEVRNAKYINPQNTAIDCEVKFTDEWLPYTATQNDIEKTGRDVYALCLLGEVTPYAPDFAKLRINKKRQIDIEREQAIASGVEYDGNQFDSDRVSISNLTGTVSAFSAGVPFLNGFVWRSSDNQNIPMTLQDLIGLSAAMLAHVNTCYHTAWHRKENVDNAETEQEINEA
jgi:hypothetical protein